jgi:hypothetical protein
VCTFIMSRYVPSILSFFRVFIMKGCWILSKAFSVCIDSVYVLYYIYWFAYVEPSLYPWNEAYFIMMYDLFNVMMVSVSSIFVSVFIRGYWLRTFFSFYFSFHVSLPGFWSRLILTS